MNSQTKTDELWPNEKLGRETDADYLSNYLKNRYESNDGESFVLNINADWGYGKTYFLKNWSGQLEEGGYPVLFFNAWKSDYQNNPMTAFIVEIEKQIGKYCKDYEGKSKDKFKDVLKSGKKIVAAGTGIATSFFMKHVIGMSIEKFQGYLGDDEDLESEQGKEASQAISKEIGKIVQKITEQSIAEYSNAKDQIISFRQQLEELVNQFKIEAKAPLFIFIDELDRCRPTYAIEVLEKVKHIFNVPGVYFVIATASNQLCHSIKSIYGGDFNAQGYLKRFFTQTYEFKTPEYYPFASYLFEKYNLKSQKNKFFVPFNSEEAKKDWNIYSFSLISSYFNLGLRDQMQLADDLYTICLTWPPEKGNLHLIFMLFLLFLNHHHKLTFEDLKGSGSFFFSKHREDFFKKFKNFKGGVFAHFEYKEKYNITSDNFVQQPAECSIKDVIDQYIRYIPLTIDCVRKGKSESIAFAGKKWGFSREIENKAKAVRYESNKTPQEKDPLDLLTYTSHVTQLGRFK